MSKYNLYGNSSVWHNLINESLINQVAHAYLFTGPAGIGKFTTAKEYIKYLLCANEVLAKRIDEGTFLDLLYITKQDKNEIGIDMIRKAEDFFRQTPAEGKDKFVIIDSADDLNLNAANALLKILEEPTANTYLFLISHTLNSLLPTIRSRCRIVKFKPLKTKELKLLSNIDKLTEFEDFIAGSVGLAFICDELELLALYTQLLELLNDHDLLAFNKFVDSLTKQPQKWQLTLQLLEYIVNRCIKIVANSMHTLSNLDQELLLPLAKRKSIEEWFTTRDELLQSLTQLEIYNLDKKQILLLNLHKIFLKTTCN